MPRPLRSPVREAFLAALLVVLLLALPGAGSPLTFVWKVLAIGLFAGMAAILGSLELQRRARRTDRAGEPHPN